MKQKIALIGHGAIAGYVAERLSGDAALEISHVICRAGREDAARAALGGGAIPVTDAAALPDDVRAVLDCAGHTGLHQHGEAVLRRGIDLISVSNGALADAAFALALERAARDGGARLRLLPGAIGAIDALSAAAVGGLEGVRYTGRKPPAGWTGSAAEDVLDLDNLTEATAHFEGSARAAALRYPKNANVAATVALAGIGMDATQVMLIADPALDANRHEIEAWGAFGRFSFTIDGNALPGRPSSSALTAMSAVRALRNLVTPILV